MLSARKWSKGPEGPGGLVGAGGYRGRTALGVGESCR